MHSKIAEVKAKGRPSDIRANRIWIGIPILLLCLVLMVFFFKYHYLITWKGLVDGLNQDFLIFFAIGLLAQLIDGMMGMGYGATSTSCLLFMGVPPMMSSTGVHIAEMFTTGASAVSHFSFGNINKKLLKNLLIPGVIGAIAGAYFLAKVMNGDVIKPYIAVYMMILGILIIRKAIQENIIKKKTKRLGILATFGGFMDAAGGGGWGPIVTSTLLGNGRNPKYTIGTVNTAEFAIAFASGITFLIFGGIKGWQVIFGLILGGVIAAPIAALLINKIKRRPMMIMVGILIILLSIRTLSKLF